MFKNPLVVGYKGEIGLFILGRLLRNMPKAKNIWCTDVNDSRKDTVERIKKCDAIFLCVPIECTACWLSEYRKYLKGKLIIEQTSLKGYIHNCKCKCLKGLTVLSMHLLFKPSGTPNRADRAVGFLDKSYFQYKDTCDFIAEMCECAETVKFQDFDHHDYRMAVEQTLLHRSILVLDKMLGTNGRTFIGQKIRELATRIKTMNPVLFEIIQSNEHFPEVLKEFKKELDNGPTLRPKI